MLFVPIVEGHGEYEAVPALLHKITAAVQSGVPIKINPPIRVKSGSFLNDAAYFNKQIALAGAKAAQGQGVVLILLDCEDDCPARLGPLILKRAREQRRDVRIIVSLAHREYESWFIAAAESFRGEFGLPSDLSVPPDFEGIRDAKGWLGARMPVKYDPIIHQVKFTRKLDVESARRSHSFDRLCRKVVDALQPETVEGPDHDA